MRALPPPPVRFLAMVVGGWVGVRAALLAPAWLEAPPAAPDAPARYRQAPPEPPIAAVLASPAIAATITAPAPPGAAGAPAAPAFFAPPVTAHRPVAAMPLGFALSPSPKTKHSPSAAPAAPPLGLAPPRGGGRWSGSAWLFVREGGNGSLAAGGMLGGSQAGARLLYRVGGALSASARVSTPLDDAGGAEAALGLDWQPLRDLPVRILAERRQALGRDGRSAFALLAYGGVSDRRVTGPVLLDGYAQAGIVGARRRDAFADAAATLSVRIAPDLKLGAGAWAAAQPGASRLDLGPHARLRLPVGDVDAALTAEWRFRVAGDAAPGSGPALTLSAGF